MVDQRREKHICMIKLVMGLIKRPEDGINPFA